MNLVNVNSSLMNQRGHKNSVLLKKQHSDSEEKTGVCCCCYFKRVCVWSFVCCSPTLSEAWRVVVHIRQADVDHSGPGQASSLPGHVLGFDHHLVVFSLFPVHVARTQSCPDHACQKTHTATDCKYIHMSVKSQLPYFPDYRSHFFFIVFFVVCGPPEASGLSNTSKKFASQFIFGSQTGPSPETSLHNPTKVWSASHLSWRAYWVLQ